MPEKGVFPVLKYKDRVDLPYDSQSSAGIKT